MSQPSAWNTPAMADHDEPPAEPDLELPTAFRPRRRRGAAPPDDKPAPAATGPRRRARLTLPSQPARRPARRSARRSPAPRPSLPSRVSLPSSLDPSRLPGAAVAAGTGAAVGLLAVALVYAGLRGCDLVRGTSSCGEPGGMVLVVAVFLACAAAGAALLSWARLPEPVSTSLLAVGATFTLCLLLLGDLLFSAWMVLLLPVLGAASYSAGHRLASRRE